MINCDVPLFPLPANFGELETVRVLPPRFCIGGDATNVAMTLAKLGVDVSISGRVGDDPTGQKVLETLRENHVDVQHVKISAEDVTTTSYHLLKQDGRHNFVYYSTTLESLCAGDVPDASLEEADCVYFGSALTFSRMDAGGIYELFLRAHAHGAITMMDAALSGNETDGHTSFEMLRSAFSQTDVFFPSLLEAEYLTGKHDPHEIAAGFAGTGIKMLGIKLGKAGSYVTDFEQEYYFSSFKNFKTVDTVGAGDSFMGGLIASTLRGNSLTESVTFASAVAGFNIEHVGATGGVPPYNEVEAFTRRNKLLVHTRDFSSGE